MSAVRIEVRVGRTHLTEVRVDGKFCFNTVVHPYVVGEQLAKLIELLVLDNCEVIVEKSR